MFFSDYISYEIGHQLDGITLDDILLFRLSILQHLATENGGWRIKRVTPKSKNCM